MGLVFIEPKVCQGYLRTSLGAFAPSKLSSGKREPRQVFQAFREIGVIPKDHVECLQPLLDGSFDVTFISAAIAQRFEPLVAALLGCEIKSRGLVKVVTLKFF